MRSTVTVLTAARSTDLTTLDRAKRELSISITDRTCDEDLRYDITMASQMCAEYCRTVFAKETVREIFHADSCVRLLVLSRKPIVEITGLTEGTGDDLVLDTDFVLDLDNGIIARGTIDSPLAWRIGKITVEYTAGYELMDGLPHSIERACLVVLRSLWYSRGRDPSIRSVDIPDVGSRTYASGDASTFDPLPAEARQLLSRYRRVL